MKVTSKLGRFHYIIW